MEVDRERLIRWLQELIRIPSVTGNEAGNQVRQYGYTQSTPWVSSLDNVTPLNLASNPYPNGLIQPAGSKLGLLTLVGRSIQRPQRSVRGRQAPFSPFLLQPERPCCTLGAD